MKQLIRCLALVLAGLFLFGTANMTAKEKTKKQPVLWTAENIKWEPLKAAPPGSGVMTSVLWGNPDKGPFGMFIKFPPGYKNPLHFHNSELKIVVVKGAYIYVPEVGVETRLGPGSYCFEPARDHHATRGAEDSETIFYVEGPGKFDRVPIEGK